MLADLPESQRVRIYLIDDHPVVRECLGRAISAVRGLEVVGEAATAADGLAGAVATTPDVVVVDLHLPDRDGPDLIAALRAALPSARLVVVSAYDDEYRVAEALRAGAHGYLLKTETVEALINGIREVAAGGT